MQSLTTFSLFVLAALAVAALAPRGSLASPVAAVDAVPAEAAAVGQVAEGPSVFDEVPVQEEHGGRMARATCDLLSFQSKWVTPNHSACAAHCLAMFKGFKGGRCRDGVCHCRK